MKVQVLSDLHREFPTGEYDTQEIKVRATMKNTHADLTVVAGDLHTKGRGIGLAARYWPNRPVIVVAGNHEYYGQVYPHHTQRLKEKAAEFQNVHFLENGSIEIGGVVFLGCSLWTDLKLWEAGPHAGLYTHFETYYDVMHNMNDYAHIRFFDGRRHRPLKPSDMIQVHLASVRWLKEQFEAHWGKRVVVVTHHAPSFRSIPETYQKDVLSAAYASHLDELVENSGARLWIHGHNHGPADYMIGKTRVLCNAKGYPTETGTRFRPSMVIKV